MRVYLDDVRPTPDGFTHRANNALEAEALLDTGQVEFISLDHDLGDACGFCGVVSQNGVYSGRSCIKAVCTCVCHMTGYDVAVYIEQAQATFRFPMPKWACHSANPAGKQRIIAAMQSAERLAKA